MNDVFFQKMKQLQDWIQWVSEASPFYQMKFQNKKIFLDSYEAFQQLPFTTADDLKESNQDFLTSRKNLWSIFSTTGSTGKPKLGFAGYDLLASYGDVMRHILEQANVPISTEELGAIFFPMAGLAVAGPLTAQGLQSLKMPVIPFGIDAEASFAYTIMKDLQPTFFFVFPSTFLIFTNKLKEIDPEFIKSLRPKAIFCAGEPLTKNMRQYFETVWNTECFNLTGSTDVMNHLGVECKYHEGIHLFDDYYFFEILDNETNKVSLDGSGELVITGLINKAMPLIRYRSKDQVRLSYEPCRCGSTSPRVWFAQRLDDRVILAGAIKFYVTENVNEVLADFPEVTTIFQLTLNRKDDQDTFDLSIEAENEFVGNSALEAKISETLVESSPDMIEGIKQDKVIAVPSIHIVPIGTIERLRGKIKQRVIDLRTAL